MSQVMTIRKLLLPLVLAFGAQVVVLLLLQQPAEGAAPRGHANRPSLSCVNPGGTGGCYSQIQDAINAASAGTIINVATGTYTEHIAMRDGISVHGQGWSNTTIHGGYSGPTPTVSMSSISAGTVLSGVQITGGGTGVTNTSTQDGGCIAIWNAAPTIVNTWVQGCTATNGGGVYADNSSPTFDNVSAWWNQAQRRGGGFYIYGTGQVTITDSSLFEGTNGTVWWNTAGLNGGGLFISGVTATVGGLRVWWNTANGNGGGVGIADSSNPAWFLANQINGNSANNGGGLAVYNATQLSLALNTLDGNAAKYTGGGVLFSQAAGLFQANWLRANTASDSGGGLAVIIGSRDLIVRGNWIEDNRAGSGGGIHLDETAAPWVDGNLIVTNTSDSAAGIGLTYAGAATITNNILARNVASTTEHLAGGIWVVSSPARVVNNTIADNTGDGVVFEQAEGVAIVNNIVSGNWGHGIEHYSNTPWISPTFDYTTDYNDVWSNSDGHYAGHCDGVYDLHVDPQFVGSGADLRAFYHILATSPVSVTGSTAWAPKVDLDDELRISGGSVSMGADEIPVAEYRAYLPLVLRQ